MQIFKESPKQEIEISHTNPLDSNILPKRGVLIAIVTFKQPLEKTEEYLKELSFLASTWEMEIVKTFIQKIDHPHRDTLIGKGKVEEIANYIQENNVQYAVFDDDLTPSQIRNLEKAFSCHILDRSLLILSIFSMRAKTRQAKTQVELAQYQYILPRLVKMWTHLSSQKGGSGSTGMRGPGEKELETDKRIIQHKISFLRKRLEAIEKQRVTQRKRRLDLIRVSLVGYTNVGKSTLMNLLSKSNTIADNLLFATVDATIRKVVWKDYSFLLTDTIGFIRKLPHTLIECFNSTLTEIKEADLLLHIIDGSHSGFQEQIKIVNQTLTEIGAIHIPQILVFNKIDAIEEIEQTEDNIKEIEQDKEGIITRQPKISKPMEVALQALQGHYKDENTGYSTVFVSAKNQINIDLLKEAATSEMDKIQKQRYIHASY